MNLTNTSPFKAAYTLGLEPSGREWLVVAIKGTFAIPKEGGLSPIAPVQAALTEADVFTGEPGKSAPLYESDFALRKPKCDILLNGTAHAPGGGVDRMQVSVQVGTWRKALEVVGDRAWVKGLMMVTSTRPIPFKSKTISYDTAFGGIDAAADPPRYFPLNHAGMGFHANLSAEAINGKRLPNTQELGVDVTSPKGSYRPMAFGAIGRGWQPRAALAGTYDQNWLDNVCPFLPADFKYEYFQSAPPDQQVPHLKGGEDVALTGLTPQGRTSFKIPRFNLPVQFLLRSGDEPQVEATVDTLLLEPDLGRFSLTARASIPLKRNLFEVAEVIVGTMPRGWHKARNSGRVYYRSLRELELAGRST